MQSVFCFGGVVSVCSHSFGAGRNYTQGFFFVIYSFCACGFVMSVSYCLNNGS